MFQITENIPILTPMLFQLILFQKTFQPHAQNAKWEIDNKTNNNTHTNNNKKQQTISIFSPKQKEKHRSQTLPLCTQ